jgi:hypothetical protein
MSNKEDFERLSLTLPETLNDWLYEFSVHVKRSGGYRIPKTLIIRAFIRAFMESDLELDLSGIKDPEVKGLRGVDSEAVEDLLVQRLKAAIRK